MVTAVGRVREIAAPPVPGRAEQRFSLARMARDHHRLYRRILRDRVQLGLRPACHATAAPDSRDTAEWRHGRSSDPAVDVLRAAG